MKFLKFNGALDIFSYLGPHMPPNKEEDAESTGDMDSS